MSNKPVLVFDVNETLLDIEHLSPFFAAHFGNSCSMRSWFAQTVLYSQTFTLSNQYLPFGQLGQSVLKMQAALAGVSLTEADMDEFTTLMKSLPPHSDSRDALKQLKDHGFVLCTLTNNSNEVQTIQLENAGLLPFFDRLFSVDEKVKAFKPAPETYRYVENELGNNKRYCLVACHTWDTTGARAAGWDAALIRRHGNAPLSMGMQPNIDARDMTVFSREIIAAYA